MCITKRGGGASIYLGAEMYWPVAFGNILSHNVSIAVITEAKGTQVASVLLCVHVASSYSVCERFASLGWASEKHCQRKQH